MARHHPFLARQPLTLEVAAVLIILVAQARAAQAGLAAAVAAVAMTRAIRLRFLARPTQAAAVVA
jgi:hypothetical protein